MGKNIIIEVQDTNTDEGLTLENNIQDYKTLMTGISLLEVEQPEHPSTFRLKFIRDEIRRMIKNSELVIQDCNSIMRTYKTQQEYILSDVKVVKTVHENLIIRLTRVLEYNYAFDHKIEIDKEEENKLFFDNTKRNR